MEEPRTYGRKAVGLSFNPSGNKDVEDVKVSYAYIIDRLHELRGSTESLEKKRLYSIAITEAQAAQMWAVKAITWED